MNQIEPHQSWLPLEDRAATETNPRHKQLLTEVRNHMEHEIKGQLDPLMDTLTANPIYHFWGNDPSIIEGREAVRGFYEAMMSVGGQQFEVVVERIVVDDNTVITEGQVKNVQKGAALQAIGIDNVEGKPVTPDDLFLTTAQLVTVWPADADGKIIGEDIYFGENAMNKIKRIQREDLPDYYQI